MKKLELYPIKFNKYWIMKDEEYLLNYAIWDAYQRPIIVITYDKGIFSANSGI